VAEARAADASQAARWALSRERAGARADLAQEARQIRRLRERIADRRRERDQLELRAPAAGILVHLGEARRPGDWLRVRNPALIAVGPRRALRVDLPASSFGRFRAGDALNVHVPACGSEPVPGRVRAVEQSLRIAQEALAELGSRGGAGVAGRVYRVVIELELSADIPAPPPGSEGWVEL
jgi:multidrug resistance efflux pump